MISIGISSGPKHTDTSFGQTARRRQTVCILAICMARNAPGRFILLSYNVEAMPAYDPPMDSLLFSTV